MLSAGKSTHRWRWGLALATAVTVFGAQDAQASRIIYSCAPELCVANPKTGSSQKLTTDGATTAYRFPSVSRDGTRIAAERASDVVVGDYGTNLTQRWTGSRAINDVALAPDASGLGESHSYVENRYGCPFTGGCLELVDMSSTSYTRGSPAQASGDYQGGGGVGFLGAGSMLSSHYTLADDLNHVCIIDTPGVPDAPCTDRVSSAATLSAPDGSPDGRLIAVAVGGAAATDPSTVTLFDAATGAMVRALGQGAEPSFSPDGSQVAYSSADGWIYVAPTAGGTARKLVQGITPGWGGGDGPGPAVRSTALRLRKNKVAVKVGCAGSAVCKGTLRIKKGKTTLGSRAYRVAAGRRATVSVKPNRRGARTIARSRSLTVAVELKPRGGGVIAARLKLRR
jgi:hypothetical protein